MIAIPEGTTHVKINPLTGNIMFYKYEAEEVWRFSKDSKDWVPSYLSKVEFKQALYAGEQQ